MSWIDYFGKYSAEIEDVEWFGSDAIGFVYLVYFTDGTKYIGKKNLYSIKKLKALKNDKVRPNAERKFKNSGKGFRIPYDVVKKESDWKTYQGSHKDCKGKEVDRKYVLAVAYSPLELTYLEAKWQFNFNVLFDKDFLNDNILNKFYKCNTVKCLETVD